MGYVKDIGSQVAVVHGYTLPLTSHAAGVTTGSTEALGEPVDRLAMSGHYNSVKNVVAIYFVGATTQTPALTATLALEHADSSSATWAAFTTATSKVIGSTSAAAATNTYGLVSQDVDLSGAKRWIRQVVTVINTATCSSDTCQAEGVLVFGGAQILPATT